MILVVSTDEELSAALVKAVKDLGIDAQATDSISEALRLAPEAAGLIFDGIPTDLDGTLLSEAKAPIVVVSLFATRPVLIVDRIVYPFTRDWLKFAITTLDPAPASAAAA
jgi:hypothetical protein